ncbi:DoxX family protein [Rariglobus hedericola]|uniref:DoxX family protein n=1 Tax=Rariglobus hedericola TaxID=2597822 RepID=A0A556QR83_9BACT|nr:DoxX family protein [Rariglobus hedericola]TSJ79132.1 DoxX family protein [Rariglobus hedericola]
MSIKARLVRTNASLWSPLVLRLVVGAVMAGHGSQKLFGWFGGKGFEATVNGFSSMGLNPAPVMAGLAAGGEFIGGILLILGLFTRLAALSTVVIMAVAIFTVHSSAFFLPAGMEYALTLLAAALVLLETGGGALSADSKIGAGVSTIKA